MVTPKGFGGSATPGSNTGVKKPTIECGIDWIAGTLHEKHLPAAIALLEVIFSDKFEDLGRGIGFYKRGYRSALGIIAGEDPYGGDRTDAYISIPASVLAGLSARQIQVLMLELYQRFEFQCSRLDLKIDDYSKTVTPRKVWDAFHANGISGFRTMRHLESGKNGEELGETVELGRRGKNGAGKFMRVYDKNVESKGKINATRIELELSDEFSRNYLPYLATIPFDDFADWIVNIICSAVKFVERASNGRLRDSKMLDWWAFIAENRDKISLCREVIVSSLSKAKSWISKQVAPTIATIMNSMGDTDEFWHFFWEVVFDGEARLQDRHRAIIAAESIRRQRTIAPRTA